MTGFPALRLRLSQVIAGAAIGLLALAIWPWVAPIGAPGPSTPAEISPSAAAIAELPPLATYSSVFDRPLFSPSRRPPADAKNATPGIGIERYRLLGVMTAGATRRALLADGNRRVEIAEGAALDGWTVARIEQDRVVLSQPGRAAVLALPRAAGANPADTPAAAGAPPR